ncbi:hypothetical protein D3C76_1421770 [compost metagenome]|uniref:YlzJ-like protein n=1 Tax=Fontibacillus panacisegetis TaxID=670482 RepID=A0A1G7EWC9_9BACL|nr:YlzJ-like family protein [Fontibacillus panacisegetis]SDE67931.1 YlzJ-like protein [Fontibacillus panacisegetis]
MTHYTIIPEELYWQNEAEQQQYQEIEMSGILMQVRMDTGNTATIVRLLRCSLDDYLNPSFAPGQQIMFFPMLLK